MEGKEGGGGGGGDGRGEDFGIDGSQPIGNCAKMMRHAVRRFCRGTFR